MKFSDDVLMAYADGELDSAARTEIEAAIAGDPAIAAAVARHRALAGRVRSAYDSVLAEPVPDHLTRLVTNPGTSTVTDLAAKRADKRAATERRPLPSWAAIAASALVGLFIGILLMRTQESPYAETDGGLVARGELADALASKLASLPDDSRISIGISFRNREGDYCRTFQLHHEASLAGLACHTGDDWKLEVLAAAPMYRGELRPAAAMPLAVLQAADAAIDGEALDEAAEAAARDAGWRMNPNVAE